MDPLLADVAAATRAERLRQAGQTRPGRRLRSERRTTRVPARTRGRTVAVALVAFVLALGGTASAAALVTGKQIKDGSLRGVDLRDGSLTGVDVRDGTLGPGDFAELVVGPQGPAGEPGPDGLQGPPGYPGNGGLVYKIAPVTLAKTSRQTWGISCDYDTRAVGGGFSSGNPYWTTLRASAPAIDGKSWVVTASNRSDDPITGYGWAVCTKTS